MPLPEGRKPITDEDMIVLLHDIARSFEFSKQEELGKDMRQVADRFSELSKFKK
jgi:hypothetical protein